MSRASLRPALRHALHSVALREAAPAVPWWLTGGIAPENCIAAYQAVGAESQAASYVNLANPGTYDLTTPAAPTWSAETGWQFNGSTQYLNTGVVIGNSWSVVVQFSDFVTTGRYLFGARIASNNNQATIGKSATQWAYTYGTGVSGPLNTTTGVAGFSGPNAWLDSLHVGAGMTAVHATSLPLYIGATNNNGAMFAPVNTKIQRFAVYNTDISTAMPWLMYAMTGEPTAALDGGWSWFTSPRALRHNNKTYIATIGSDGPATVRVASIEHPSGVLVPSTHGTIPKDDHANPSTLIRASDKRVMAWYCGHNANQMWQRISANPEDIWAWGTAVDLAAQLGGNTYSYSNPVQLTGEANSPIYLFYRDLSSHPSLFVAKSEDEGTTWGTGQRLYRTNSSDYPYWRLVQNGNARIDFAIVNHPTYGANALYHFYYQAGSYYQSDGTLIGDGTALPLEPGDGTVVYDGTTTKAWVWDIAINGDGHPVIAYTNFPGNDGSDHRYRYARWTGTEWDDHEIVAGGTHIYGNTNEPYYSGGIALDHANINVVYASVQTPATSVWEIVKYVTTDGGATWTPTAITSGSSEKNIRPVVPRNAHPDLQVVWLAGTYNTFLGYNLRVRGYPAGILD